MRVVAGEGDEPFLARVIDIVEGNSGRRIVHLEVVGVPGDFEALRGELVDSVSFEQWDEARRGFGDPDLATE